MSAWSYVLKLDNNNTAVNINLFDYRSPLILRKVVRRMLVSYAFHLAPKTSYEFYLKAIAKYYKNIGVQDGMLALSFDCDLEDDMIAIDEVRLQLHEAGFGGSWALIGDWVERYPEIVQRLIDNDQEIVNHTMTHPNNQWLRPNDPRKFNQVSSKERQREIERFHTLMVDRFCYKVRGFRAPHFCMMEDVYEILSELDYIYSSSKLLLNDECLGVIHNTENDVLELPMTTSPLMPREILESYSLFRGSSGKYYIERDFFSHFQSIVEMVKKWRIIAIIYLDPCDVIRLSNPPFKEYLGLIASKKIQVKRMDNLAMRFIRKFR